MVVNESEKENVKESAKKCSSFCDGGAVNGRESEMGTRQRVCVLVEESASRTWISIVIENARSSCPCAHVHELQVISHGVSVESWISSANASDQIQSRSSYPFFPVHSYGLLPVLEVYGCDSSICLSSSNNY